MTNAFVSPQVRNAVTPTGVDATGTSSAAKSVLSSRGLRRLRNGVSLLGLATTTLFAAQFATAQTTTPPNIVGACSGVSLPPSVVTEILRPVITGIATPTQDTINGALGSVRVIAAVPLLGLGQVTTPNVTLNAAGLLDDAANGKNISLGVLSTTGVAVGPNDSCVTQADGFTLRNPAGIAIGGNRISGLGATGPVAVAGEGNSIAFGNAARTDATAAGAIALGTESVVGANATGAVALGTGANATAANSVALGAGSLATRGPLTGYTAIGLGAAAQTSTGEVSVGTATAQRQITNVAAGQALTDAVNVAQLTGVQAQIGTVASGAVQYDDAARASVTLGGVGTGAAPVALGNVAAGSLGATSTDAVNGSQLFATNTNVTNTNTALTNLTTNISNGGIGAVQ